MQDNSLNLKSLGELPSYLRKLIEVLALGHSNREAGRKLGIGLRTVELRRHKLAQRLGAKSAFQLGYLAAKLEVRQNAE